MTPKEQLAETIMNVSQIYNKSLTPGAVLFMIQAFEDIETEKVIQAFLTYCRNNPSQFFPSIGQIREIAAPDKRPLSVEDLSRDASNRIVEAMAKYGWTNPERAKEHIGTLGWKVVEREGGWRSLCERTLNDDLPITKAQWRELAAGIYRAHESGRQNTAPQLPDSSTKEKITALLPENMR